MNVLEAVSVIVALLSVGVTLYRTRPETRKLSGEAADSYASAADKFARQVTALQERMGTLDARVDAQEQEIDKLRRERDALKEWAERLVHQVRSLGAEPVKMMVYEE